MSKGRTYEDAKAHARHYAVITGQDYGVMRDAFGGCMAFPLSPEGQRSGSELRCEVVRLADITPSERARIRWLDENYGDNWREHGDRPIPPDAFGSGIDHDAVSAEWERDRDCYDINAEYSPDT